MDSYAETLVMDNLIPNSAWKDYSAANTNYAFEAFEAEEKQPGSIAHTNGSSRSTMPLTSKPMPPQNPSHPREPPHGYHERGSHHYADTRSLQRPRYSSHGPPQQERSTYSLPRHANQPPPPPHHNGYYTHRPPRPHNDQLQPDFYFMPSQRKYSGEVVRVYVDYNNPRK
uniref:Uncharacterized protein n=1 Tax=Homalodisca liturata TaxID=320908 RepID=A0A1B6HLR6_9HEMI